MSLYEGKWYFKVIRCKPLRTDLSGFTSGEVPFNHLQSFSVSYTTKACGLISNNIHLCYTQEIHHAKVKATLVTRDLYKLHKT